MFATDYVRPPHRWRGRDLAFFGGTFFLLLVAAAIAQAVMGPFVQGPTGDVIIVLALTVLVEGLLLGSTVVLVRSVYGLSYRREMCISRDYRVRNRSLMFLGLGLALSVIIVSALVSFLFPDLVPAQQSPLEQLLSTPQTVAIFAVFGIIVAPGLEELMFRGFLFRVLEDVVGVPVAVWTTAALFAVAHGGQLWPNWPAIIVILVVGYVLSRLRERTRSVIPGFIVHTTYNAVLFLMFAMANFLESPPV